MLIRKTFFKLFSQYRYARSGQRGPAGKYSIEQAGRGSTGIYNAKRCRNCASGRTSFVSWQVTGIIDWHICSLLYFALKHSSATVNLCCAITDAVVLSTCNKCCGIASILSTLMDWSLTKAVRTAVGTKWLHRIEATNDEVALRSYVDVAWHCWHCSYILTGTSYLSN